MLIKDGNAKDKMSDGHRTYSGNDYTTRHWHFGKKSEKVMEGTCEKCVFGSGIHSTKCEIFREFRNKHIKLLYGDINSLSDEGEHAETWVAAAPMHTISGFDDPMIRKLF